MVDMQAIAASILTLEDQLVTCMRCGMCQAVCPLYAETGMEADVARGKLALLDGILQNLFERPNGVEEKLNKCLLCGSCQANCPSGVHVIDIFLKARAILSGVSSLSVAQKLVLKGILAHPRRFDRILLWATKMQDIMTRPANDLLGTSCARVVSPLIGNRHFKKLAPKPFHKSHSGLTTKPGRSGYKIAFFVGCLLDKVYPEVAQSVVTVCEQLGIGLYIPKMQGCCGIPALAGGDMASYQKLVEHNLDTINRESFDYLITACATCTSTIKKLWPGLMPQKNDGLIQSATELAEKTLDISQFLIDVVGLSACRAPDQKQAAGISVTYHDPCHLKKSLGVCEQPRKLIHASDGCLLKEMNTPDRCCGMGGSFGLKYYDISRSIGKRKIEDIRQTGCRVVATSCPACMLQLSDMLSQSNERIAVKHVIELFAEGIKKNGCTASTHQIQKNIGSGFRAN